MPNPTDIQSLREQVRIGQLREQVRLGQQKEQERLKSSNLPPEMAAAKLAEQSDYSGVKPDQGPTTEDVLRPIAQGASFYLSDELVGGAKEAVDSVSEGRLPTRSSLHKNIEAERAANKEAYNKVGPVAGLGLDILGGVATGGAATKVLGIGTKGLLLGGGLAGFGSSNADALTPEGALETAGDTAMGAAGSYLGAKAIKTVTSLPELSKHFKAQGALWLARLFAPGSTNGKINREVQHGIEVYTGIQEGKYAAGETLLDPKTRVAKLEQYLADNNGDFVSAIKGYASDLGQYRSAVEKQISAANNARITAQRAKVTDLENKLAGLYDLRSSRIKQGQPFDQLRTTIEGVENQLKSVKNTPFTDYVDDTISHLMPTKVGVGPQINPILDDAQVALAKPMRIDPNLGEAIAQLQTGAQKGAMGIDELLNIKDKLNLQGYNAAGGTPSGLHRNAQRTIYALRNTIDDLILNSGHPELVTMVKSQKEFDLFYQMFPKELQAVLDVPRYNPNFGSVIGLAGVGGSSAFIGGEIGKEAGGIIGRVGGALAGTAIGIFTRRATSKPDMWYKLAMYAAKNGNESLAPFYHEIAQSGFEQVAAKYSMLAPEMWAQVQQQLPIVAGRAVASSPALKSEMRRGIMEDSEKTPEEKARLIQDLNSNKMFEMPAAPTAPNLGPQGVVPLPGL